MTTYTISSNPSNETFAQLITAQGGDGTTIASGNTYIISGSGTAVTVDNSTTENGGTVIVESGATFTFSNGVHSGTAAGIIDVYGGTLIYQNTNSGINTTINMDPGSGTGSTGVLGAGTVEFSANSANVTVYNVVSGTTEILLPSSTTTVSARYHQGVTAVTDGGIHFNLNGNPFNIPNDGNNNNLATSTTGAPSGQEALVCFLAGAMIRTASGEVPVETIKIGDSLVALAGGEMEFRKVVWAGKQHVSVRPGLPSDEAGYPVRILKDAIAECVPHKDLLVTPEHCLFFDGNLIPARMLVNGRTIFYDRSIISYDYYHVETEKHSVIWANGMPTESYIDTGNRAAFLQTGKVVLLAGGPAKSWEKDAAAPLAVAREIVEPVFAQIAARAGAMNIAPVQTAPVLTSDADLHLVTDDGRNIRMIRQTNGHAMFMIPSGVESVRIVSRTARPVETIGPFIDDRRDLGVLVGAITLFEYQTMRKIDTHLKAAELPGWHKRDESAGRWTNGYAILPLGQRKADSIALLDLTILSAGPYQVLDADVLKQATSA